VKVRNKEKEREERKKQEDPIFIGSLTKDNEVV
jgi:hypothetical protein